MGNGCRKLLISNIGDGARQRRTSNLSTCEPYNDLSSFAGAVRNRLEAVQEIGSPRVSSQAEINVDLLFMGRQDRLSYKMVAVASHSGGTFAEYRDDKPRVHDYSDGQFERSLAIEEFATSLSQQFVGLGYSPVVQGNHITVDTKNLVSHLRP